MNALGKVSQRAIEAACNTPIREVLARYCSKPSVLTAGSNIRCPSPDHEDRNPSAWIGDRTNRVHCPVCQAKGWDAIALTQMLTGCSFRQAVEALAQQATGASIDLRPRPKHSKRELKSPINPRQRTVADLLAELPRPPGWTVADVAALWAKFHSKIGDVEDARGAVLKVRLRLAQVSENKSSPSVTPA